MTFQALDLQSFAAQLASRAAVPGGGGASALVGALAAALGSMVGELTVGKRKYAAVEPEVKSIMECMGSLRERLLALIDADVEAFLPLSRAYGLPRETEEQRTERQRVMEEALQCAARPPLAIMEACGEVILLHAELIDKGSVLALSDVGVGAVLARAALQGAALNVFINTASMTDRNTAKAWNARADALLERFTAVADDLYDRVRGRYC